MPWHCRATTRPVAVCIATISLFSLPSSLHLFLKLKYFVVSPPLSVLEPYSNCRIDCHVRACPTIFGVLSVLCVWLSLGSPFERNRLFTISSKKSTYWLRLSLNFSQGEVACLCVDNAPNSKALFNIIKSTHYSIFLCYMPIQMVPFKLSWLMHWETSQVCITLVKPPLDIAPV